MEEKRIRRAFTREFKAEIDQHAWFGLMWQRSDGTFASLGPASGINEVDAA